MRFLLDEMLSGSIASELGRHGVDAMAVVEHDELRQLDDAAVLAAAVRSRRAVVTYNRDDFLGLFNEYLERDREHHGIVLLNHRRFPQRQPAATGGIVRGLRALAQSSPGESFLTWLQ